MAEARKATPEGVQALKDLRLECQSLPWIREEAAAPVAWEVRAYAASGQSVARVRYETLAEAEAEQRRWEATGTGRRAAIETVAVREEER